MNRIGVIALIAAVALVGVVYLKTTSAKRDVAVAPPQTDVHLTTGALQASTTDYEIDAKYPQFGIPSFDASIRAAVEAGAQEIKDVGPPAPSDSGYKNTFDADFEDAFIAPDMVSVKLELSQYTGGAHSMTIVSGLNWDRREDKILLPEDALLLVGMKDFNELSEKTTALLRARLAEALFPEGATSNPENFSSFWVGTSSVTFIFQTYQVAAYAAGVQEVTFPRIH